MSLLLHPNGRRKAKTFHGEPCIRCGATLRYELGVRCVACQRVVNQKSTERQKFRRFEALGLDDFHAALEKQGWACAICKRIPKTKLVVDHCHKTNRFRGLLCYACNTSLGKMQESVEILEAAIEYLSKC